MQALALHAACLGALAGLAYDRTPPRPAPEMAIELAAVPPAEPPEPDVPASDIAAPDLPADALMVPLPSEPAAAHDPARSGPIIARFAPAHKGCGHIAPGRD